MLGKNYAETGPLSVPLRKGPMVCGAAPAALARYLEPLSELAA